MIPEKYYTILGLLPGAGLTEIRKAYRAKVKLCHPDAVAVTDGNKLFIELTEAYEFLLAALQEKTSLTHEEIKDEAFIVFDATMQDLVREEMEKIRLQAREEARRKYKEFQQSKEFRINKTLGSIFDFLFQLLGAVIIVMALWGVSQQLQMPDFSYLSLFAAMLVVLVGMIMIFFPFNRKLAGKKKKT